MSFNVIIQCPICGTENLQTFVPTVDRYQFKCTACKYTVWDTLKYSQFEELQSNKPNQ
jgi:transposase-like protein